jgi:hypothetical protein
MSTEEALVREGHPATILVLDEVRRERERQDVVFGVQRHPSFPPIPIEERAAEYGVPTEAAAKELVEKAFKSSRGTWGHVLVEELAETIAAPDEDNLRHELIQLAAVATAWVEDIDRRRA